jgi:glycosyltransferase involved in cell wall biosynthesis
MRVLGHSSREGVIVLVPSTTIVVVEKESFSCAPGMLQTLVAHTPEPRRVIVVDSGAPRAIRRRLDRFAVEHDVTLLRSATLLNANEERNIALEHVTTDYVAFVDHDSILPAGWLSALERCARETGAAMVSPVITWGPPGDMMIHFAGGVNEIVDNGHIRRVEHHDLMFHRVDEIGSLHRAPMTTLEAHCLLVRTDVLRRIAPLDEQMMGTPDHLDLALRALEDGGSMWLEPAVVVQYWFPKKLTWRDQIVYVARWSDQWIERSYAAFDARWCITESLLDDDKREAYRRRRLYRERSAGWRGRGARTRARVRARLDRIGTSIIVRHYERQRARAVATRVVHAATWDATARAALSEVVT